MPYGIREHSCNTKQRTNFTWLVRHSEDYRLARSYQDMFDLCKLPNHIQNNVLELLVGYFRWNTGFRTSFRRVLVVLGASKQSLVFGVGQQSWELVYEHGYTFRLRWSLELRTFRCICDDALIVCSQSPGFICYLSESFCQDGLISVSQRFEGKKVVGGMLYWTRITEGGRFAIILIPASF
jgi:hypothetical protein